MAITPLKQKVIHEAKMDETGRDGRPLFDPPVERRANVTEQIKMTYNNVGVQVVSHVTVILDKLAPVRVGDRLTYTDELGRTYELTVVNFKPVRMFGRNALQTEVYCE